MAGRAVQRPAPVAVLSIPTVADQTTQRALEALQDAVQELQEQIRRLRLAAAEASTAGSTGLAGPFYDTVIDTTGTPVSFGATYDNWSVGTLGQNTLIKYITDGTPTGSNSRGIRGLVGGVDGKIVTFMNMSSVTGSGQFAHLDAAASIGNQFNNCSGGAVSGNSKGCVTYYYDGPTSLWRQTGASGV